MVKVEPRCEIANAFHSIPAVEAVYVNHIGSSVLQVLTLIDDDTDELCDAIYDREREVIQQYGSQRFDFNIVARRGRSVLDVIGDAEPAWKRQDSCLTPELI